ncbi:hypothetical protein LH678_19160 [Acinetobacter baumannii]|uniref:hypothetical protein n=1 Tax=Acinetobacter baumannii TaxID=470 RepID=UPI001F303533|nr:hypothetical protein [Acinetobacter baumannii]MCF1334392.1 hypothetical protein [Acinetobacter baumannii]
MIESILYFPINQYEKSEMNFITANYKILERADGLIKAELSHYSFGDTVVEDEDHVKTLPKIFYIDHGNSLILDEQHKPIATTNMIRRR